MKTFLRFALASLVAFAGTMLPSAPADAAGYGRCGRCGTVVDVDRIWYDRDHRRGGRDRDSGAQGAVAGAIIGGLLGNQVGGGSGRDAATVAGAIAGGLIGRNVDRDDRGRRGERGTRLVIRMDRGYIQTVEVAGDPRLYKGDRVRVRNDRVVLL